MGTTHAKQNYIAMRSYTRSARRAGDQAHLPDILTLRHSIEYQLIIRIWRLENFKIPADNDIHMLTGITLAKKNFAGAQVDQFQLRQNPIQLVNRKIREEGNASKQICGGHNGYFYCTRIYIFLSNPHIERKQHCQCAHQQYAQKSPGSIKNGVATPTRQNQKYRRCSQDITMNTLCGSTPPRDQHHSHAKPAQFRIKLYTKDTSHKCNGKSQEFREVIGSMLWLCPLQHGVECLRPFIDGLVQR